MMDSLPILGLDEAGRGPILGPMVIASVALQERAIATLLAKGLADSKTFGSGEKAHAKRTLLYECIVSVADFIDWAIISTQEIDEYTSRGELNVLERLHAVRLLEKSPISKLIIADGKNIFGSLRANFPTLIAENKADVLFPVVAAASIVAKVKRDEAWFSIAQKYEQEFEIPLFSSGGYINPTIQKFLHLHKEKYGIEPTEIRKSWKRKTA